MSDNPLSVLRRKLTREIAEIDRKLGRPPRPSRNSVLLGTNRLSGRDVQIPLSEFQKTHTFCLGRSGVGKTKFLEQLCRPIMRQVRDNDWSLIVLDGKGGELEDTLVDPLFAYGVATGVAPDRTTYFNPHASTRVPGINILEVIGNPSAARYGQYASVRASKVKETLALMLGESDDYRPWWDEHAVSSLLPLILSGFTLTELEQFLSLGDPRFRDLVLGRSEHKYLERSWKEFRDTFRVHEQATMINVVKTRAKKFLLSELLTGVFGQEHTTVDWVGLMDHGGVFLGKFGFGPTMTSSDADFIGRNIVHQVVEAAAARSQRTKPKPCFLVVDEFERFVSSDFETIVDVLRGYGVHLIASCQHLGQLQTDNTRHVLESMMASCRIKVSFSVSRKDAEEMALEIFAGTFHRDEIIETITNPGFRPVETTRTIRARAVSHTDNANSGSARNMGSTTTHGTSTLPNGDVVLTETVTSQGGSTESDSGGASDTITLTETPVPWYEYEKYEIVGSRRAWTVEQLKERAYAMLSEQGDRDYYLKIQDRRPLPLRTPTVKPPVVDPDRLAEALAANYNQFREIADVCREVHARVPAFLDSLSDDEHVITKRLRRRPKKAKPAD